jgi:hypothetical protein
LRAKPAETRAVYLLTGLAGSATSTFAQDQGAAKPEEKCHRRHRIAHRAAWKDASTPLAIIDADEIKLSARRASTGAQ